VTRRPPQPPPLPTAVGPSPPPLDRFPRLDTPWELLLIEVPDDADILQTLRLLSTEDLPSSPPPLLLVIADPNEVAIRAFSPSPPSPLSENLQASVLHNLYDAIVQPLAPCQPACPPALLVEDASLLKLLREPLLGWGIPVRKVESLSSWTFLPNLLDQLFSSPPDSMVSGAAHEEHELCTLAARLARIKPWLHLQDTQFILAQSDDVPITHPVISFLGSHHDLQGVIFYRSVESVAASLAQWPLPPPSPIPSPIPSSSSPSALSLAALPSTPFPLLHDAIALLFSHRRELTPEARNAFRDHDLPTHRDLFPRFIRARPNHDPSVLHNPGECLSLCAVLEALCDFLERNLKSLQKKPFPLISQTIRVTEGWELSLQSSPPSQQRFLQILQHFSPPPAPPLSSPQTPQASPANTSPDNTSPTQTSPDSALADTAIKSRSKKGKTSSPVNTSPAHNTSPAKKTRAKASAASISGKQTKTPKAPKAPKVPKGPS
jgi:hypothetical protein